MSWLIAFILRAVRFSAYLSNALPTRKATGRSVAVGDGLGRNGSRFKSTTQLKTSERDLCNWTALVWSHHRSGVTSGIHFVFSTKEKRGSAEL